MSSSSISLIMSTRVLYEDSEEIIELMKASVLSVFISFAFNGLSVLLMQRYDPSVPKYGTIKENNEI